VTQDGDLRRAEMLRMRIVEDVLNIRCPRCRTVFMDFTGCFNLTCSRSECGAQFCAHCLRDYALPYTARHVEGCPIINGRSGTLHEFQAYHRSTLLSSLHLYLCSILLAH